MHGRNGIKRYVFIRYIGHCESQREAGTGMADREYEPVSPPGVVVDTVREAQASAANEQRHSLYKVRRL